jgi:hypothetical protein
MSRSLEVRLFLLFLATMAGCGAKLETGYAPRKLGTLTPAERRGLYAQDFSIEAQAAQADQNGEKNSQRNQLPGGQE